MTAAPARPDPRAAEPDRGTPAVAQAMIRRPKSIPHEATVGQARAAFADDHVHMLLLTEGDILRGTLVRGDLDSSMSPGASALAHASLRGRTVAAGRPLRPVHIRMVRRGQRRLAVTDPRGRLVGLLCLKRHGNGFCSDAGIAERAGTRCS